MKNDLEKNGEETKKSEPIKDFVLWQEIGYEKYMPGGNVSKKLPSGFYNVEFNSSVGRVIMSANELNTDELYKLPHKIYDEIITNVSDFFTEECKAKFKKFGYSHKRGILLYGKPGNGKSYIINYLINHLIKNEDVIVINFPSAWVFKEFISQFRSIEPDRKILVIMEDIDAMMRDDGDISSILNVLDGNKQIENVCYIATTNYPERLQERVYNRPSRFDKRYAIADPTPEVRNFYFQKKLEGHDISIDLKKWVDDTDGFSFAHLKELIVSYFVFGFEYEEAIARLQEMKSLPKNSDNLDGSSNGLGFKNPQYGSIPSIIPSFPGLEKFV